jgi:hypothetical protein
MNCRAGEMQFSGNSFGAKPIIATDNNRLIYLITSCSVIRVSTCFRFSSKVALVSVAPTSMKGKIVTVTLEKGFGTANPSQELNRQ